MQKINKKLLLNISNNKYNVILLFDKKKFPGADVRTQKKKKLIRVQKINCNSH